jgi:hypothetical protein
MLGIRLRRVVLGAITVLAAYALLWPAPIDPVAWSPPVSPGFAPPFERNAALSEVELWPVGEALLHRHRRRLQRGRRARRALVVRHGVAQILDAQIHGQLLGRREDGRGQQTVDLVEREPGVGDRRARGFEHELRRAGVRAAHVRRLADPDDGRAFPCRHRSVPAHTAL